ncbi:MAG: hypothetical protein HYY80_03885, partial [Chloroflexi bacterium]|nr:hypothetical protein [Chloroflexota bacterium]
MPSQLMWLIFLLPVFSFGIIILFVRPFVKPGSRIAGYITIAALGGSLVLSLRALAAVIVAPGHEIAVAADNHTVIVDSLCPILL